MAAGTVLLGQIILLPLGKHMALGPGLNGGDGAPGPGSDGQQLTLTVFHNGVHDPNATQKVVICKGGFI